MPTQILKTKLFIPPARPQLIARATLVERLNEGRYTKLTLVSAPAGFGKSTILSQWIDKSNYPTVWLSLDEGDSDLARFLTYIVSALQNIDEAVGEDMLEMLQSPQQPPIEALLTTLLNDISTISDEFFLMLDDYHAIDSTDVDDALIFLLDHLPPQMHLVIATREDPQIQLARLRVRGELTELRVADLRFSADETADFLNQMMNLNLSRDDILALETRTEGWIAGLQLAGLSLQGRDDTASFIDAFTGSHRFVLDYLVEEVLGHQPDDVRLFLLRTSILERFSGGLCDAVMQRDDGKNVLDILQRDNLFLVSLDDRQEWYRYHHLFADALHTHLKDELSDEVADLHLRASHWYEANQLLPEAIHHALLAEDFDYAADLIEMIWPQMDEDYQLPRWLRWLEALPEQIVLSRPMLSLGHAWALLNKGEIESAEKHLHEAEHWLSDPDNLEQMVIVEAERLKALPAAIAGARAYRSLTMGDIVEGIVYAKKARELAISEEHTGYRQGTALLGIAYWASGDLQMADDILTEFMYKMRDTDNLSDAFGTAFMLGEIYWVLGRLRDAFRVFEQWLDWIENPTYARVLGCADIHRGLAELYCERNDLDMAQQFFHSADKLSEITALPNWQNRYSMSMAQYQMRLGDLDTALELLDVAGKNYTPTPLPIGRPVEVHKARVWIRQGRLDLAEAWVQHRDLSFDDDLPFVYEFDYITLARLLIAQYKAGVADEAIHQAQTLLKRLHRLAEHGQRKGHLIEILILQALAYDAQGDVSFALTHLEQALSLAEPEGFVARFVNEGAPMQTLLDRAIQQDIHPIYAHQLKSAFTSTEDNAPITQDLIDPLSDRELDVLKLLTTELSGPQIADKLMISLNTMRSHTKNIYSKLAVNSRRSAVRRAEELGIL